MIVNHKTAIIIFYVATLSLVLSEETKTLNGDNVCSQQVTKEMLIIENDIGRLSN